MIMHETIIENDQSVTSLFVLESFLYDEKGFRLLSMRLDADVAMVQSFRVVLLRKVKITEAIT